jgi:6,7-dimethyl-8-ribityllumazine synthase
MSKSSPEQINTTGIRFTPDACVVIVRTEWNAAIVDLLESGCKKVLEQNKVSYSVITVPGAFEIGFAINHYWENHKYRGSKPCAFIALGCVFKGDTPHFEYVSSAVTDSIARLNITLPVPTIFGVLTVNTQEQADERTGGKHGNKGEEAADTALKMITLARSFKN